MLFGLLFSRKCVKKPHTKVFHGFLRPGSAKLGFLGPDYGFHTKSELQACTLAHFQENRTQRYFSEDTPHKNVWHFLRSTAPKEIAPRCRIPEPVNIFLFVCVFAPLSGAGTHTYMFTQIFVDGFGRWEYEIRTPRFKLWFSHQF